MSNRKKRKLSECEVCGRQMSQFFKGDICSAACRQKKTRMKRDAGRRLLRIQRDMHELINTVDLGLIDLWDTYELYHDIWEKVRRLGETIDEKHHRQAAS